MIELYINDIYGIFNIEKDQINISVVKAIITAMKENNFCTEHKQKLMIDKGVFEYCWSIYQSMLIHFDPNYNRRNDFLLLFRYVLSAKINDSSINFNSLFCPGYTRHGYKEKLGHTTVWKLEELYKIRQMLDANNIKNTFSNYYSDVFLENCDSNLEPNWLEQMKYNRELFHKEGEKYFSKTEVLDASSLPIFSSKEAMHGYVNDEIVQNIKLTTYSAFIKSNRKFYESLNFTEEQMKIRNDRLITMYKELSNYLNKLNNVIFLPMENMYERENIFSENGTCTMYLKLKGE